MQSTLYHRLHKYVHQISNNFNVVTTWMMKMKHLHCLRFISSWIKLHNIKRSCLSFISREHRSHNCDFIPFYDAAVNPLSLTAKTYHRVGPSVKIYPKKSEEKLHGFRTDKPLAGTAYATSSDIWRNASIIGTLVETRHRVYFPSPEARGQVQSELYAVAKLILRPL